MNNCSIDQVNSIFEQPWWLDAVAPGQWDVAEVIRDGQVIARLPYVKNRRLGFNIIGMPSYTQTLGCWVYNTGAKNARKYTREKELIWELIKQIPSKYNVDIELDHFCDYLFPFKWNGFKTELRYSYRLENIYNIDQLWGGLADNIRREIKKAQKKLIVEDNHSIDDLILMQDKTFKRQGRRNRNDSKVLRRVNEALKENNAGKLLCAVDDEGRLHAASLFIYDDNCCYYLVGGADPVLRNSGASSLLMWEGIKFASTVSRSFDFEGSMIEPIERFFRAFGGVPTPYWRVTKFNLPLSIAEYLKPKVKKFIGWK